MSENQKKENIWPLFVMGTQRSGTTFLTRVLSAHKYIFVQNEAELPCIFDGEKNPIILINNIKSELASNENINIDEFIHNGCKVWGLKDPQLTEHIAVLKYFLPHSKFIVILRDGRGVANSYMENKWGLGTNAYTGAIRWKNEVQQQLAFMKTMPENFFLIKFEDLLQDLESSMKSACNFLDVEFDAEMLNYNKQESYYEMKKQNVHTFKKPDIQLTKKWQQKLSEHEIDVIECVAGDILDDFGYMRVGKPIKIGRLEKFYYRLHQSIIGEIQIQYKWRRFRIMDAILKFRER